MFEFPSYSLFIYLSVIMMEVKAVLFPSLNKYHAMTIYPLLNLARRHEDVLGSSGIAPRILNFDARQR